MASMATGKPCKGRKKNFADGVVEAASQKATRAEHNIKIDVDDEVGSEQRGCARSARAWRGISKKGSHAEITLITPRITPITA